MLLNFKNCVNCFISYFTLRIYKKRKLYKIDTIANDVPIGKATEASSAPELCVQRSHVHQ